MGGWFCSPKSKEKENSLVSEGTQKVMQYNTKSGEKNVEEWQQQCAQSCK